MPHNSGHAMSKDPLYRDGQQDKRVAGNPQIMARIPGLLWVKTITGLAVLALIGAIWLVWRLG